MNKLQSWPKIITLSNMQIHIFMIVKIWINKYNMCIINHDAGF